MLKRESEDSSSSSEQPAILPNFSEAYPRSILKSSPYSRPVLQIGSADTSRSETDTCAENQNLNNDAVKHCEKLVSSIALTNIAQYNLCRPCDDTQIAFKLGDTDKVAVPSHKIMTSQREKILSDDLVVCKSEALPNCVLKSHECYDDSSMIKIDRTINDDSNNNDEDDNKKDADKEKEEIKVKIDNDNDRSASSSFDSHKVHNIVNEEKHSSDIAWYFTNLLEKSVNQYALDKERQKQQRDLPLLGLCHSATQVTASRETIEAPSIADRLAALRNSNMNWKWHVADTNSDKLCDSSAPFNSQEENTVIKSGVLTDCIDKLESPTERRKIVAPDAINFTVFNKMKVTAQSNDSGSFLMEVANILNQKKKVSNPRLKDKGEKLVLHSSETEKHLKDISKICYIFFGCRYLVDISNI